MQIKSAHYTKSITNSFLFTVPFACTSGFGAATAMTSCMKYPSTISVTVLEGITDSGAAVGNIDSTSNMRNDKVYIFDGKDDSVVNPGTNI